MRQILPFLAAALGVGSYAGADGPSPRYQLVSPKGEGIIAVALNERGDLIGFEWVEETARPGVIEQKPFLAQGKTITYLPLLPGYTATFPAAMSDDRVVVGRAGRPAPPGVRVRLRNQAFLWDAKAGIRGLGTLPDDWASFACGITRDGRSISGYSVGDNRVRACIWDREGDGWKATALPQKLRLGSNSVPISGNGRHVTAADGLTPCLWSRNDAGQWTREAIGGESSLIPRAVNDAGTVVGVRFTQEGESHAMVWTRAEGMKPLAEPGGYERSEASAVNNLGAVVGMVDGPRGSNVTPRAFVYEQGRLRLLSEGGPFFTSATAVNDHGQVAGVLENENENESAPQAPAARKSDPGK